MMLTGILAACGARTTGCSWCRRSGFTNNVGAGMAGQKFAELGAARGVIGQGMELVREMQLQRELGNIDAEGMEDNRDCSDSILARIRAPETSGRRAQSNRFEFGAKGTRRTTLGDASRTSVWEEDVSRARRRPPACRPRGDPLAWLAAEQGRWKNNIQGRGEGRGEVRVRFHGEVGMGRSFLHLILPRPFAKPGETGRNRAKPNRHMRPAILPACLQLTRNFLPPYCENSRE